MRLFRLLTNVLTLVLLLAACTTPAPKPTPAQAVKTSSAPAATAAPTRTPLPTQTPRPSITPTITLTVTPSATFTVTPDSALSMIELIGLAWYSNYDMLLSFQFPGPVEPSAYRVTLEDKEYHCETITKHPDQLYCRGQGAKVLAVAWVRVYSAGSMQAGFEKRVWVPYFDNNYNSFAP